MPRENLLSLFCEFERHARDVAAVYRRGYRRESWTYGQLAASAVSCALELRDRGIRTGDRVLLWGPNSAEWVAAFWGCLLIGAVAVPMDDAAAPSFAARVVADSGVKFVFASREKPILDPAIGVLVLEDLADTLKSSHHFRSLPVAGETRLPFYQTLADEPITRKHIAQILFTSGTTAEPRGVVLTHGNFLANLEPLERGIDPYRRWERWCHPLRFVTLVPLSHVFGQIMTLFVPPLLGAAVVFEPSFHPSEIIRTTKKERATALITVPRMLEALQSGLERDLDARSGKQWLPNAFGAANRKSLLRRAWIFRKIHRRFGWKFWAFISGGAALSSATEEFFKRMGYAVVQGYGMTETASLITLNHPFRATQGYVGKVLPGREFRMADDGEILVRGESVSAGYWEAGLLRPSEEHGWLRTGDIGELDTHGNLRFRGRKKNVIVTTAGLKVYPEDLEAALRKQPSIRDCAVIPFERNGNPEPCAVLLLHGADNSGGRAAVEAANASLADYQSIRSWLIWTAPDFPRTPTGKPRLAVLAASVAEILGGRQADDSATAAAAFESANSSLDELLLRFLPAAETKTGFSPHSDRELNLSSLDRVELMSALEERFQTELNETAFAEAKTVADIEHLLEKPARRTEYIYPRWIQREPVRRLRLLVYYALVWPATVILGHPKVIGRDRLRAVRGPALIVANHITRRADVGLVLHALPLRFRHQLAIAMGGETLEKMHHPPHDWFFAKRWAYQAGYWLVTVLFNVFPLPQFSGFRESFRFVGESVDRGYSVLVFPEGVVNNTDTGEMAPFQLGIGLLVENLRLPIVPIRLDGVWQVKREGRRFAKLGEITIRIGAPVTFPPAAPPTEIARFLESLVRSL
jgi:long-chain acyl-CoA synthetase